MIFFFDVDMTLLWHEEWRIPDSACEALRLLKKQGHRLYLNTSRSPNEMANARPLLRALPLDGEVLMDGGMTFAQDQLVDVAYPNMVGMEAALRLLRSWGKPVRWQTENELYFDAPAEQETRKILLDLFGEVPPVRPWQGERLVRMVCYCSDSEVAQLRAVAPQVAVSPQGHTLVNITAPGIDKYTGMLAESARLGYEKREIVAFGDGTNDIGMLRAAGTGIAMGQSSSIVQQAADYVTTPIEQDGIWQACRHFGWI